MQLTAYSDSDWAGDTPSGRSTTGIILKLAGAAINWFSQKQSCVAQSSTEAEYIAANEAARDVHWARVFLSEIDCAQPKPTPLFIDNSTAIRMALEEGNTSRRKHINVKHHYVREQAAEGFIDLQWIPTAEQQADIMTKALALEQFTLLRDLVMGQETSDDYSSDDSSSN
jgi:hypothetical protein